VKYVTSYWLSTNRTWQTSDWADG